MKVVLGRKYRGGEVLEAFMEASKFNADWRVEEVAGPTTQTPEGLIVPKGAKAYSTYEQSEFCFFAPRRVTRVRGGLDFTLEPVVQEEEYSEVDIEPWYLYGSDFQVTAFFYTNKVTSPQFRSAKPDWDAFINAFYAHLRKEIGQ